MPRRRKRPRCIDCGKRPRPYRFRVVKGRRKRFMLPYCMECRKDRAAYLRTRKDVLLLCSFCGRYYLTTRGALYDLNADPSRRNRCDSETCRLKAAGAKRPVNPRGPEYCRAPVEGGCDRKHRSHISGTGATLCHAHARRVERGADITTPINPNRSRAQKRAYKRRTRGHS